MKMQLNDEMTSKIVDYAEIDALANQYFGDSDSNRHISFAGLLTTQSDLELDEQSADTVTNLGCSRSCTNHRPQCCG
jgi:hypothetical protein